MIGVESNDVDQQRFVDTGEPLSEVRGGITIVEPGFNAEDEEPEETNEELQIRLRTNFDRLLDEKKPLTAKQMTRQKIRKQEAEEFFEGRG